MSVLDTLPLREQLIHSSASIAGVCIFTAVSTFYLFTVSRRHSVDVTEGAQSTFFNLYQGAYEFTCNAQNILLDGYDKLSRGTFKVPSVERWMVIVNKPELIEEVRKAPDSLFSFRDASSEMFACRWTTGDSIVRDPYHEDVVRYPLTKSLNSRFTDIHDEIIHGFSITAPMSSEVSALRLSQRIVCGVSNRFFVGLPLCRNEDYIHLNIIFTVQVAEAAHKLSKVPQLLKPFVGPWVTSLPKHIHQGLLHLRPILEERFRLYDTNGDDWNEKPDDLLSWLIDAAPEKDKRNIVELTRRVLIVNFVAIHTTAISFTHALLHLAAESEKYVKPLRQEVEEVIRENGWSKASVEKMVKIDSFMMESQRINGTSMLSLIRKVLVNYTLSDGTFLPAGTFVAANTTSIHHDESLYDNPDTFDGFRFVRKSDSKHQMSSSSTDYLPFGHGRHACPGRFFAVMELKTMMAHVLLNYDVALENKETRPSNFIKGIRILPDPTAKILLTARMA